MLSIMWFIYFIIVKMCKFHLHDCCSHLRHTLVDINNAIFILCWIEMLLVSFKSYIVIFTLIPLNPRSKLVDNVQYD